MIKFVIVSRRKSGWSRERFFYEWAFIHVALMVLTPPSMRRFKRYVQHYGNADLPFDQLFFPPSAMAWESFAEHWIETLDTSVPGPEYTEQMQPHSFSDSAMEIAYLLGETVFEKADFRSGGVKLIHRLARQPGRAVAEMNAYWREQHAPRLRKALEDRGLRRYVLDTVCDIDPAEFRGNRKGTLFEKASIDPPLGYEELWFDSLADALQVGRDAKLHEELVESYRQFSDRAGCYSMVVNERVVFDFITPGEITPLPAVLQPGSLESQLFTSGRPYHEPRLDQPTAK